MSKTYRVGKNTVEKIKDFAEKLGVTQSEAIDRLIDAAFTYIDEKKLESELDALSNDQEWLKESVDWAEHDLS